MIAGFFFGLNPQPSDSHQTFAAISNDLYCSLGFSTWVQIRSKKRNGQDVKTLMASYGPWADLHRCKRSEGIISLMIQNNYLWYPLSQSGIFIILEMQISLKIRFSSVAGVCTQCWCQSVRNILPWWPAHSTADREIPAVNPGRPLRPGGPACPVQAHVPAGLTLS